MRPTSAACTFLLLSLAGLAAAQEAAPAVAPAPAAPVATPAAGTFASAPDFTTSPLAADLAHELRRLALLEIRSLDTPAGDDYACTGYLLDLAGTCQPQTVEQLRQRLEAAFNAGDDAAIEAVSRTLLKLDPSDTRSQLRLISTRISRMQTAEQRLAASERLLGPEGAKIDPSVRSRIALDAALLAREQGDQTKYASFLKLAAQLDATNKDAAVLLYQFFVDSNSDRVGAAELLANLIYADPLDPAVHQMLRNALLDVRAFPEANRFAIARGRILNRVNIEPNPSDRIEHLMMIWYSEGPEKALADLEADLRATRDDAANQIAAMDEAIRANATKPENVRIAFEYEEVRLASAIASGNRASVEASLADMSTTVGESLKLLSDPTKRNATLTEERAAVLMRDALKILQIWRLVSAAGVAQAAADMPTFEAMKQDGGTDVALVKAWLAFRSGDAAAAQSLLAQAEPSNWGALLAAELAADRGDKSLAVRLLLDVYSATTLAPLGGLALSRAAQIDAAAVQPDAEGKQVAAIANTIPKWLDGMADDPRLHQVLKAKVSKPTADARESVTVEVEITNISRLPLGLGGDRPLNSRLLFTPVLEGREGVITSAEPEILEIGGRLRLMPGETLRTVCEPDAGVTGWLASVWCKYPTRLRWRILQGFEPDRGQSRRPGPGCVDLALDTFVRRAISEALRSDTELAGLITQTSEGKLPDVLYAARASLLGLTVLDDSPRNPAVVAQAIADRFPLMSPAGRALTLCIMPPSAKVPELAPFDLVAGGETEPRLQALVILTRVTDPADPMLAKALASGDAALVRIASVQKARLEKGRHVYATRGVPAVLRPSREPAIPGAR